MKKIASIAIVLLLAGVTMAQVPATFNYQAVARNADGTPVASKAIKVKLSVTSGILGMGGTVQYSETQSVATNAFGLFTVIVGGGGHESSTGSMSAVTWGDGISKRLQVEMDISGGNNFTIIGTETLQSTPYAIVADKVVNQKLEELKNVSTATLTAGDMLKWDGTKWINAPAPASGVITTYPFSALVQSIAGNSTNYVFAGFDNNSYHGQATVTITSTSQRLTGTAVAPLGFGAGATYGGVRVGMCYQRIDIADQPVVNFVGTNYSTHRMVAERRTYTVAGSVTGLQPGTYKVGMGVLNGSSNTISDNDYVNGWVQVY